MDTISTTGRGEQRIPAHIRRHLQKQPSSGKTIKDYCKGAGFSAWTFYNWRKRYGHQPKTFEHTPPSNRSKPPLSFATIGTVHLAENRQPLFDIRFPTGTIVSIYNGTTSDELAPFLSLLCRNSLSC